jgi:hypothetical protein
MLRTTRWIALPLAALWACGGSQPQVNEPFPGEEHVPTPPATGVPPVPPAEGTPDAGVAPSLPEVSGSVIELRNEADTPIHFGVTKGWGPIIFAYTGKPPKAKSVILFETACTASCDTSPDEICPVCPEPATKKEELAMARTETAEAGQSLRVPWDGKIRVYQKAPGTKCKCFTATDPPADSYTVKACGLRPPREPGKPSRPVCAEAVLRMGGAEAAPPIVLSFPK